MQHDGRKLQHRADSPIGQRVDEVSRQRNIMDALLDNLSSGVFMVEAPSGKPLIANRMAKLILGQGILPDANKGNLSEVYRAHKPQSPNPYPINEMPIIQGMLGVSSHVDDMIVERPDGSEVRLEVFGTPVRDEYGRVWASLVNFYDVTERSRGLDEVYYLSFHDHLTGLYNRRFFEEELKRLDTSRNWPLTLIMGDINSLKLVNDTFGHTAGDELLVKAAETMKRGCREDDILSRIGGDEFMFLLPCTDNEEAEQFVQRIKEMMTKETVMGISISTSYGHATKTKEDENIETIYQIAEDRMYANKLSESATLQRRVFARMMELMYMKAPWEEEHAKQVSLMAARLATAAGMLNDKAQEMGKLGFIHDIGKISVPDGILNRPGPLQKNEMEEIQRHAETGYRILLTSGDFAGYAQYVLAHHERWDGKGYPQMLKGYDIPVESRIIAIVGAYDAMTGVRYGRTRMSKEEAINELRSHAGTQFDPELVQLFIMQLEKDTL